MSFFALLLLPFLAIFALWLVQAYIRSRYAMPPEAVQWKLGIPVQTRQLPDEIITWLGQLKEPIVRGKGNSVENTESYIAHDTGFAIVRTTPISKQIHLTIGFVDLANRTLQIRIALIEILHVISRTIFLAFVLVSIARFTAYDGAGTLWTLTPILITLLIIALYIWRIIRFIRHEADLIEQFLHDESDKPKATGRRKK